VAFEISDVPVHDGQTQEQALPPELAQKLEDEETLDEVDAVPVIDTMVLSTEEIREQEEADARARWRHRRRRAVAWLVLLLFVAAVAAALIWRLLS
jgi:hypothetical protein